MKTISTSRITSRRTICAIIFLQALTLASFFLSVRVADSYLPELGGSGRASSIYLWNGLANLAFLVLAGLWVTSLWLVVRANMPVAVRFGRHFLMHLKGQAPWPFPFPFWDYSVVIFC